MLMNGINELLVQLVDASSSAFLAILSPQSTFGRLAILARTWSAELTKSRIAARAVKAADTRSGFVEFVKCLVHDILDSTPDLFRGRR